MGKIMSLNNVVAICFVLVLVMSYGCQGKGDATLKDMINDVKKEGWVFNSVSEIDQACLKECSAAEGVKIVDRRMVYILIRQTPDTPKYSGMGGIEKLLGTQLIMSMSIDTGASPQLYSMYFSKRSKDYDRRRVNELLRDLRKSYLSRTK